MEIIKPAITKEDEIQALERLYKRYYDELPFTPHDELEKYIEKLETASHSTHLKLKLLRESKKITIPDMARLLDMSKDGYFKIENGANDPKLKTAFKIAKLLGSTVDELFGVIEDL